MDRNEIQSTAGRTKWYVVGIVWFFAGVAIASVGWGFVYFKNRIEWAMFSAADRHGDATVGEWMLRYLESPDATNAQRLTFAASNYVALFPSDIKRLDEYVPLVSISERYYQSEMVRFEKFMAERSQRLQRAGGTTNGPVQ